MGFFKDMKRWFGFKKAPSVAPRLTPTKVTFLRRFDNKENEAARRRGQIACGMLRKCNRGVV